MRLIYSVLTTIALTVPLLAKPLVVVGATVDRFSSKESILGTGKNIYPVDFACRVARLNGKCEAPIAVSRPMKDSSLTILLNFINSIKPVVLEDWKVVRAFENVSFCAQIEYENNDVRCYFICREQILVRSINGTILTYEIEGE
jgi:hypothetical protein